MQRAEQEFLSGEASRVATKSAAEYDQAIEKLRADSPGITEPECIEAMTEPFERIAAAYGDEAAAQPEILRQLYQVFGPFSSGPVLPPFRVRTSAH